MSKPNGAVLWRGSSRLDGAPIVVIATGFRVASKNSKTGDMIQTWILREDIEPHEAIKSGEDRSICGNCPLRAGPDGKRGCYVLVHNAPLAVWRAYHRGGYPDWSGTNYQLAIAGHVVRIGSYGDPAACPVEVWRRCTKLAKSWTGYTHQWRRAPGLRPYCMASVETQTDADAAAAAGWRYFRIAPVDAIDSRREVLCPASAEAGRRTTCAECTLCMGAASKARKSIAIPAHGPGRRYVTLA